MSTNNSDTEEINVDGLKTQRATIQGLTTKLKNFVLNSDNLDIFDLETRLQLLENYFKQFTQLHSDIVCSVAKPETEVQKFETFEETYCTAKSQILRLVAKFKTSEFTVISSSLQESGTDAINTVLTSQSKSVRLPKLSLKKFSGRYTDWKDFSDAFTTLIDKDSSISDVEKFQFLRSCLTEGPLQTIKALETTAENYKEAWKLLTARFDNKCIIFQAHVKAIFDLPCTNRNSVSQLRELVDSVNAHLRALKALGTTEDLINTILLHLVSTKLDNETLFRWEDEIRLESIPTWDELSRFLSNRCVTLENRDSKVNSFINSVREKVSTKRGHRSFVAANSRRCLCCNRTGHLISQCTKFISMTPLQRFYEAKRLSLCLICLVKGHSVNSCSKTKCSSCQGSHHKLLHRISSSENLSKTTIERSPEDPNTSTMSTSNLIYNRQPAGSATPSQTLCAASNHISQGEYVFLATAVLLIRGPVNSYISCRAFLDSGSQINFITQRLAQQLNLKKTKVDEQIQGIGDVSTRVKSKVTATIKSRLNDFYTSAEFWVLPTIADMQPSQRFNIDNWKIPADLDLADPWFNKPQKIDLLLGASVFFDLLEENQIRLGEELPIIQRTRLGWIVTGKVNNSVVKKSVLQSCIIFSKELGDIALDELLTKFWCIENCELPSVASSDQNSICENHFCKTVARTKSGRFIVRLPFKGDSSQLGDSFQTAYRRFLGLERKLDKQPELRAQYNDFMKEYQILNHMESISSSDISTCKYFLPHHCVIRPESSSTKLRVVFDASCSTTSSLSLNDVLMVGPTIQAELFDILLRFRFHKYAITADITKMYRQILIHPADAVFQCIIWRQSPDQPLEYFKLKTVTYGTASAPFLATRCLKMLAEESCEQYPLGSRVISNDFYMDDMLTGGDTLEEVSMIRHQVSNILQSGQFELRKWCTNDRRIWETIPEELCEKLVKFNETGVTKTLGVVWDPVNDQFYFVQREICYSSTITKRCVVSDLSRLFDPLGLINPIIVLAKIFVQELWILKVGWDEPLPENLCSQWEKFRYQLKYIQQLRFPRFVGLSQATQPIELHGFADASNRAYGCCIFVRTINSQGSVSVKLLCAKSRVSPLKTISLPRLELCGAQLLARVFQRLTLTLSARQLQRFCWTDSTIILDWLASHPSTWTTFVANRVATIHELLPNITWRHVSSKENPADIVSRGMLPEKLINCDMWFHGPTFLQNKQLSSASSRRTSEPESLPERRSTQFSLIATKSNSTEDLISRCKFLNSFAKLRRVFAYILRFIHNARLDTRLKNDRRSSVLSANELHNALRRIIWNLQNAAFAQEIRDLRKSSSVNSESSLRSLCPFLDERQHPELLRVGGRLLRANLPYSAKFPILLPRRHPFLFSLLTYYHEFNFHAGPQALVAAVRQRFWVINARQSARTVVHRCIRCFRARPNSIQQLMGDLPAHRIQTARPFTNAGIDFCGPIWVHFKIRGKRPYKAYIAVFICFATKAVHLEVVSDLSTQAFIAALKRFVARRGFCHNLYCDNATNFVGANRELKELHELFNSQQRRQEIVQLCAEDQINFHHIPPRSPHFGGLWEAAVKAAKFHLFRMVSKASLTYEELSTVVTQIEAVLNSRPLTPISSDANDLEVLTPGHFLIGGPLTAIVEPDMSEVSMSRLSRWQLLRSIQQHFWKRWSKEYVSQLQQRSKWTQVYTNIRPGTLVLISEDDTPPLKWPLGRVTEVHHGHDGLVRVVSLRTQCGTLQRAVQRICPLPIESTEV